MAKFHLCFFYSISLNIKNGHYSLMNYTHQISITFKKLLRKESKYDVELEEQTEVEFLIQQKRNSGSKTCREKMFRWRNRRLSEIQFRLCIQLYNRQFHTVKFEVPLRNFYINVVYFFNFIMELIIICHIHFWGNFMS